MSLIQANKQTSQSTLRTFGNFQAIEDQGSGTPLAASLLLSTTHHLLLKREESPHSTQKKRCMQVDLSSDLGRFVFRNSFIYLKIFFLSVYLNFESLLNLVHYCFYFLHFLLIIFGCTGFLLLPVGIL